MGWASSLFSSAAKGMGASSKAASGGLKGLLSDEGFMSSVMKKGGASGGGQAYQRGFQGGDQAGMQSYQDMMGMGMSKGFDPMQGLMVVNNMQYRPNGQHHPFRPIWSYQPIIRRR